MSSDEPHESTHVPNSTSLSNIATELVLLDPENSSSIYKTFQTTELCEGILSHLSLLELWRARSVCKTFQKVIDHSPLLQKNTFLKPRARITSETISHQAYLDQHEIHPLISNLSLDLARNMTLSQLLANEDDVPDTPKLVRLFNVIKHDLDNPTPPIFFRKSFAFGIESGDDSPVLRMYLSNPPSESVLLSVQVTLKRPFTLENVSKHHQLIQVFNRNGVTFRRVIEESKRKIVLGYLAQIGRWAWEMKIQVFSLSGLVESVPQLRNPN